ncbi:hypothetical protein V6N11_057812 [Hibiscus sabdariffa]|uniref:Uncharacterized protein n=2 Tax=Hibiscus sabdariffa TaxID=183260 RepID=A0ABR2FJ98_9ROSI
MGEVNGEGGYCWTLVIFLPRVDNEAFQPSELPSDRSEASLDFGHSLSGLSRTGKPKTWLSLLLGLFWCRGRKSMARKARVVDYF